MINIRLGAQTKSKQSRATELAAAAVRCEQSIPWYEFGYKYQYHSMTGECINAQKNIHIAIICKY